MDTTRPTRSAHARLVEIGPEECWELLDSAPVGRLAWTGADGLTVVPVNFTVDDRSILFRTLAYGTVARECDDSAVAFQVDHADPEAHTGWSVLVRGRAHIVYGDTVAIHTVDAWPEGTRLLPVRVRPGRVTGRRLTTI